MLRPRRIRTDNPTPDEALFNLLMTMLETEAEEPASSNAEIVAELRNVVRRLANRATA